MRFQDLHLTILMAAGVHLWLNLPPDKTTANCPTDGSKDGPSNWEDREYDAEAV